MKRGELRIGEVYAVQAGKIVVPVLLASNVTVTLSRLDEDSYELSRRRAAQGKQGGGLLKVGGSVTGVTGVLLPMTPPWKSSDVEDWILTGTRPGHVTWEPTREMPAGIASAYHLARDFYAMAMAVAYHENRITMLPGRTVYRYTDAAGANSVQAHVFPLRAFLGTWVSYIEELGQRHQREREHDLAMIKDMKAIRERLESAGFTGSVFFTGDDSNVVMSRTDFYQLLKMI